MMGRSKLCEPSIGSQYIQVISYDLVHAFRGTKTGWACTNDQDIDIAAAYVNGGGMESFEALVLHFLSVRLADLPLVVGHLCVWWVEVYTVARRRWNGRGWYIKANSM